MFKKHLFSHYCNTSSLRFSSYLFKTLRMNSPDWSAGRSENMLVTYYEGRKRETEQKKI